MELNIEPSTIFWDTQNGNEALYYGTEGIGHSIKYNAIQPATFTS